MASTHVIAILPPTATYEMLSPASKTQHHSQDQYNPTHSYRSSTHKNKLDWSDLIRTGLSSKSHLTTTKSNTGWTSNSITSKYIEKSHRTTTKSNTGWISIETRPTLSEQKPPYNHQKQHRLDYQ
ncbi:Hypothetical predicted protein [Pelobates cultripes]|uniref:Uncharacterized protein n=1 Tax=Pelobates cultripes TaxID=61616 RepID=A0AAD1TG14_PELCU|nr:Hypothetical predicted protein [Pelobates cultripes]